MRPSFRLSAWLFSKVSGADRGPRKWWEIWAILWFTAGFRQASVTTFRLGWLGVKRWFYLGGDEARTARHESFWIALGATTAGLGGVLRFLEKGTTDHAVGWLLLGMSLWICLAFFFPLWLPRVRDADLIRQRRETDRNQRAAIQKSLSRAVDAVRDQQKESLRQEVQALLDRGSALRTVETNYRAPSERHLTGTANGWENINAWRDEAQASVETHFASEAFRISGLPRLSQDSTTNENLHVIDEALRPLHNWRNELAKP
jgi:hypothetical protein